LLIFFKLYIIRKIEGKPLYGRAFFEKRTT
jgi:hypothetical protein